MRQPQDREKKRCKIMVDYAEDDICQLQKQGYDFEQTMIHFHQWIYNTIKRYIADDWQCTEGLETIDKIIRDHIKGYFQEVFHND